MKDWFGVVIMAIGLFPIAASVLNWEWFFTARKARFFVDKLGRNGARVWYGVLGLAVMVLGLLGALGIVDLTVLSRRR
jgi:hypothetical protein